MGTGNATIDYDPRRGNNGDGSWGIARKWLDREVLEQAREYDPQFGLTMEGLGDLPSLYAAALCSGVYQGNRNVVRYAFPDRVLLHGMANAGRHGTGGPWERYLATFREGMRWDIVGNPNSLPVALLNLTRPFLPELYQSRFLDTEGLETSDPRIEARRFDATDTGLPSHLITLTNPERISGQLQLVAPELRAAGTVLGVTLDGRLLEVRTCGDGSDAGSKENASLTVPLDGSILAAVLLVPSASDPQARFRPVLWPDWSQKEGPLKLFVFNLAGQPRETTVDLRCLGYTEPYGQRLPEIARFEHRQPVSLAAHGAAVLNLFDLTEYAWLIQTFLALPRCRTE